MKTRVTALFVSLFVLALVAYAGQTAKTTTLKGWVSDSECAAKGDKKCSNKQHVANGAKLGQLKQRDDGPHRSRGWASYRPLPSSCASTIFVMSAARDVRRS